MVNFPGPWDEIIGVAALVTVLESRDAWAAGVNQVTRMGVALRRAIMGRGIEGFSRLWIPARLLVSLQLRLFVETVLFSMGKPWSELVSGFKPLKMSFKGVPTSGQE